MCTCDATTSTRSEPDSRARGTIQTTVPTRGRRTGKTKTHPCKPACPRSGFLDGAQAWFWICRRGRDGRRSERCHARVRRPLRAWQHVGYAYVHADPTGSVVVPSTQEPPSPYVSTSSSRITWTLFSRQTLLPVPRNAPLCHRQFRGGFSCATVPVPARPTKLPPGCGNLSDDFLGRTEGGRPGSFRFLTGTSSGSIGRSIRVRTERPFGSFREFGSTRSTILAPLFT